MEVSNLDINKYLELRIKLPDGNTWVGRVDFSPDERIDEEKAIDELVHKFKHDLKAR